VTSQLPWPSWMLIPAAWPACRRLASRCLEIAAGHELPPTLMLVGEAGLGREALAVDLAAGLAVHGGPPAGCNCPGCDRVRRGVHPDVEIVTLEPKKGDGSIDQTREPRRGVHPDVEIVTPETKRSDISIDQTRELIGRLDRRPYEGQRRVVVFSSCQTPPLNTEAATTLLKTLEEPPGHVTFLLLAANPNRVLPTIQSRSVQVRVPLPGHAETAELVAAACGTDPAQSTALLQACHGHPAVALATGDPSLLATAEHLEALLPAALAGDGAALLRTAQLIQRAPEALTLAVATLLREAASAPVEDAERVLAAAAALVAAERRRAALRLDHETAVLGALTPFAAGRL